MILYRFEWPINPELGGVKSLQEIQSNKRWPLYMTCRKGPALLDIFTTPQLPKNSMHKTQCLNLERK